MVELIPVGTNVRLSQEELAAKVGNLHLFSVMQGDRLDSTEDDVLGDLHAKPLEATNQHRGILHPLHRLLACMGEHIIMVK